MDHSLREMLAKNFKNGRKKIIERQLEDKRRQERQDQLDKEEVRKNFENGYYTRILSASAEAGNYGHTFPMKSHAAAEELARICRDRGLKCTHSCSEKSKNELYVYGWGS